MGGPGSGRKKGSGGAKRTSGVKRIPLTKFAKLAKSFFDRATRHFAKKK